MFTPDTENTEALFLFAHRETAMGKKTCTFGDYITRIKTKRIFMLQHRHFSVAVGRSIYQ